MTKENLVTLLAQLTDAEAQLKTPTFENLFNNVRYQTSNVQRSFEQFFDTLKSGTTCNDIIALFSIDLVFLEAPDASFAKQIKTYFKMSHKGSLDFVAISTSHDNINIIIIILYELILDMSEYLALLYKIFQFLAKKND